MPAEVHALLVARADPHIPVADRLRRAVAAVHGQTHPVTALTIVLCGADEELQAQATASGAAVVIQASHRTTFAGAVRLAAGTIGAEQAVWLLAQDTVPEPDALQRLVAELDTAPMVAMAAPKLVRWVQPDRIASLGVSMTRLGRTVRLADGEFDQGQHDGVQDVLGGDVRGILIRGSVWPAVQGPDPGLGGADEGLDLGVRARLAGGRVSVVPAARITVRGDGVAGLPGMPPRPGPLQSYRRRRAQLHRRLAYAHAWAVVFLWLSLLPVAVWRTAAQLVAKNPGRILPEWGATFVVLVRVDAVIRARLRIRRTRTVPWSRLAPLRVTARQLRTSLHLGDDPPGARRLPLRFFAGGGFWVVLGALVVSVATLPSLLVWPALGGGALAPLSATVGRLWADAGYGLRSTGLASVAPADPFAALLAVLGTLWPADPTRVVLWLWLLALPLAALGAWFAATRLTDRSVLRAVAAVVWALAPTFLAALEDGRPTGVLVHLLLPWLLYTGAVAHRSWGYAGLASFLLLAVVACAPILGVPLAVVWIVVVFGVAIARRGHGVVRVVWVVIPTVLWAIPLVWRQLAQGTAWGLLADPGRVSAGSHVASDAAGRALLAAGIPSADIGGWRALLGSGTFGRALGGVAPEWMLLLLAPLGILALSALFTRRQWAGAVLWLLGLCGLAAAFAAVGVSVSVHDGAAVSIWPGSGLSLVWAGGLGAAILALDVGFAARRSADADRRLAAGRTRMLTGAVVMLAVAVFSLPALTATVRGTSALTDGPVSTLPAYVAAEGRSTPNTGTVVLTAQGMTTVAARVVWGASETLNGASTVLATRPTADASDDAVAALAADLVTAGSSDVVKRLQREGIGFVLLGPADDAVSGAAELSRQARDALDQRDGLDAVGTTDKGVLWRVTGTLTPRAGASAAVRALGRGILVGELLVIAAVLLLAVPTGESRRRARYTPRVVGRRGGDV